MYFLFGGDLTSETKPRHVFRNRKHQNQPFGANCANPQVKLLSKLDKADDRHSSFMASYQEVKSVFWPVWGHTFL